jgi:hypothetical protein
MSPIGPVSNPPVDPWQTGHHGGGHKVGHKEGHQQQIAQTLPQQPAVRVAQNQEGVENAALVEEENPLDPVKKRDDGEQKEKEQEKQNPQDEKTFKKKQRGLRNIGRTI